MATYKSDIEIAQSAKLLPIEEIADRAGIDREYVEYYGKYKAKINTWTMPHKEANAKLVLVTAITPTPAGEGKTTTTIGLADGLNKIGKKPVVALREPSLGPVFGVKAAQQEADMLKLCLWKISIYILQGISMLSGRQTIFLLQCSTTISIKETL